MKINSVALNFGATLLLAAIIASPFYIAKNLSQVAGTKTEAPFLITSQVDRFPNMKFEQVGKTYKLEFRKVQNSQAYLQVILLTNPTNETKTYEIVQSDKEGKVFFGENYKDIKTSIVAPAGITIPLSVYSDSANLQDSIQFEVIVK